MRVAPIQDQLEKEPSNKLKSTVAWDLDVEAKTLSQSRRVSEEHDGILNTAILAHYLSALKTQSQPDDSDEYQTSEYQQQYVPKMRAIIRALLITWGGVFTLLDVATDWMVLGLDAQRENWVSLGIGLGIQFITMIYTGGWGYHYAKNVPDSGLFKIGVFFTVLLSTIGVHRSFAHFFNAARILYLCGQNVDIHQMQMRTWTDEVTVLAVYEKIFESAPQALKQLYMMFYQRIFSVLEIISVSLALFTTAVVLSESGASHWNTGVIERVLLVMHFLSQVSLRLWSGVFLAIHFSWYVFIWIGVSYAAYAIPVFMVYKWPQNWQRILFHPLVGLLLALDYTSNIFTFYTRNGMITVAWRLLENLAALILVFTIPSVYACCRQGGGEDCPNCVRKVEMLAITVTAGSIYVVTYAALLLLKKYQPAADVQNYEEVNSATADLQSFTMPKQTREYDEGRDHMKSASYILRVAPLQPAFPVSHKDYHLLDSPHSLGGNKRGKSINRSSKSGTLPSKLAKISGWRKQFQLDQDFQMQLLSKIKNLEGEVLKEEQEEKDKTIGTGTLDQFQVFASRTKSLTADLSTNIITEEHISDDDVSESIGLPELSRNHSFNGMGHQDVIILNQQLFNMLTSSSQPAEDLSLLHSLETGQKSP